MMGKTSREEFMNALTAIIEQADFTLFAVVIDKNWNLCTESGTDEQGESYIGG